MIPGIAGTRPAVNAVCTRPAVNAAAARPAVNDQTARRIMNDGGHAMPVTTAPTHRPAAPGMSTGPVQVSIVEDYPLYRAALARLVDGLPEFALGPLAGSVEEFLAYRVPAGGVVLLDLNLPGRQGAAAVLALAESGHRPLVLSAQAAHTEVLAALAAGARGYLTKAADADEVTAAVRQVAAGGTYVSPTLAAYLLDSARPRRVGPQLALTNREREVLGLLAEGERDIDIARALTISVRTVRSHLDRIREKTGQRRRSELTRLAIGEGIVHRRPTVGA